MSWNPSNGMENHNGKTTENTQSIVMKNKGMTKVSCAKADGNSNWEVEDHSSITYNSHSFKCLCYKNLEVGIISKPLL